MIIRLEREDDRGTSVEIERLAFERDLEAEIARTVVDEDGSFALVAEVDGTVIGHVQMSRGWIGATPVTALGPIGVLPERQGQGCGGALVHAALEEAARRGERVVMLLGSPAFYPRFGFVPGSTFGLKNPYAGEAEEGLEIAEEDFMVAPLDDDPLELEGLVRWHPAFDETG
jgi:putative acetyltransferase